MNSWSSRSAQYDHKMLVINATLTLDLARRSELAAAAIVMQQASRPEAGCHHYVFSADLEHDDVMHIAEKWEDQAALDAHFATPHMAVFQSAIAGAVTGIKATKYEIASEGPLR